MFVLLGFLGAAAITALLLFILLRTGLAWRIATDLPNHRSLHSLPVPRVGGWGMVPAWMVVSGLLISSYGWLLVIVFLVAAVSYVDDRFGLSPAMRFPVHWLAAGAVVLMIPGSSSIWAMLAVMVVMVWMTNLFNFMDGSDGMAGGMALFGFGGYALLAWWAGNLSLLAMATAASGAALGFLCFNFHPARVFLGDAGSIPFGFLSGGLGWLGTVQVAWPWWLPLVMFSPFVFDASLTLLRRALRGEKVWLAHREHYYQRMVQMGFGHRKTAMIYYVSMFGAALLSIVLTRLDGWAQLTGILIWLVLLGSAARVVDRRWLAFSARGTAC